MTKIRQMIKVFALVPCLAATAYGQYSQPVREVEKEARSAVSFSCPISWPANHLGAKLCTLTQPIPAGKIFAVRNVSVRCSSRTAGFIEAFFNSSSVQSGQIVPLQVELQSGGHVAGAGPSFLHVGAGSALLFRIFRQDTVSGPDFGGQCEAHAQGFLIDQQ